MATVQYTKTNFLEPKRIDDSTYTKFKSEIDKNENYNIEPTSMTFSEHFSGSLYVIKICIIAIILGLFTAYSLSRKSGDWADIIGGGAFGLGGFILIFQSFYLLLEGPSYSKYLNEKNIYFQNMKNAIKQSNSYSEFCAIFYV